MTNSSSNPFPRSYIRAIAEINLLQMYINQMDESLADVQSDRSTSIEAIPDATGVVTGDDEDLISGVYSEILNAGFLISLTIFLEKQMNEYAKALQRTEGLGLSIKDIRGSLPERLKKYCLHIAQLPALTAASNWQDIRGFWEIRNCLVHSEGRLVGFGKSGAVKDFVARHGMPEIDNDMLIVDTATSRKCLEIIREFIDSVYGVAIERYPSRRR